MRCIHLVLPDFSLSGQVKTALARAQESRATSASAQTGTELSPPLGSWHLLCTGQAQNPRGLQEWEALLSPSRMPLTSAPYVSVQGLGGHHAHPGANTCLSCPRPPILCLGRRPWYLALEKALVLPFQPQGSSLCQKLVAGGRWCPYSLCWSVWGELVEGTKPSVTTHTHFPHEVLGPLGGFCCPLAGENGTGPVLKKPSLWGLAGRRAPACILPTSPLPSISAAPL